MEILFSFGIFIVLFLLMSVGVIFSNRILRGSCGGPEVLDSKGDAISCGACPKKEKDVCTSDNEYAKLATVSLNPKDH